MFADAQTVRDLEIFDAQDGGSSVFDLVNMTRTGPGAVALRYRLGNPLTEHAHVSAVQDAVRFLREARVRFHIDGSLVAAVTRYLDSPYEVTKTRTRLGQWLELIWLGWRYGDLVSFARDGARNTLDLVRQVRDVVEDLSRHGPPSEVSKIVSEMRAILERLEAGCSPTVSSGSSPMELDRLLRSEHSGSLRRMLQCTGELDALFSMADSLDALNLVLPQVRSPGDFHLDGEGVHHLFLPDPVSNPVRVVDGKTVVFVTGPNMAGKTTYLKAVGVAAYLAHCGMGVPAKSLSFTPVERLITSLRPEDHIRRGLSFFMSEVVRVRHIAEVLAAGRRAFVLFDEIFRGTNYADAIQASKIVIRGFSRARDSGFMVSSHLTELVDDLRAVDAITFVHFDGEIDDRAARYDFTLREGVSRQRFGLQLLRQERVPELLDSVGR